MDLNEINEKLKVLESEIDARLKSELSERDRRLYLTLKDRILRSRANVIRNMKIEILQKDVKELKKRLK